MLLNLFFLKVTPSVRRCHETTIVHSLVTVHAVAVETSVRLLFLQSMVSALSEYLLHPAIEKELRNMKNVKPSGAKNFDRVLDLRDHLSQSVVLISITCSMSHVHTAAASISAAASSSASKLW